MKLTCCVLLPPSLGPLGSGDLLQPDMEGVLVIIKLLYEQVELIDHQFLVSNKGSLTKWSSEDVIIAK